MAVYVDDMQARYDRRLEQCGRPGRYETVGGAGGLAAQRCLWRCSPFPRCAPGQKHGRQNSLPHQNLPLKSKRSHRSATPPRQINMDLLYPALFINLCSGDQ